MSEAKKWRPIKLSTLERNSNPEDGIEIKLSVAQANMVAEALMGYSAKNLKNRDRMTGGLYYAICNDRHRESKELAERLKSMASERWEQMMEEQDESAE